MLDNTIENNQTQPLVFFQMTNVIQNYAWGSKTSINQLFDIPNSNNEPQAEIWMGAHPSACSMVESEGQTTKLSTLINQDINAFLSEKIANRFGELPYLFKVLAAQNALSIQVHPNKKQAEIGFAREEQQGIAHNAYDRNYKDPNHKPELVYALTKYDAMNGFRSISEIIENFTPLNIEEISSLLNDLIANQHAEGLKTFFTGILSLNDEIKASALTKLLSFAKASNESLMNLIVELEAQYPNDIGLFAPLMLNVIRLEPGQAMFLDAETPHAYLKGTALEIMANSDNVLRAGLTPKFMDIQELAACTLFEEKPFDTLLLEPNLTEEMLDYPIPVEDFKFAIIPNAKSKKIAIETAEILFAIESQVRLTHANGQHCVIEKGQSVFIPAYAQSYTVESTGRVARAYC